MQRKRQKQKNKIKGQKFESKVEKCINSGSLYFDKGDLRTEDYLIECKYTDKKGFRLTNKILEKIWNEALERNKLPKIILGISRNEDDMFIVTCDITIKRK